MALGTGDVLGAFGSLGPSGDRDLFLLPAALSVLTRPCHVLVELADVESVRKFLKEAGTERHAEEARGRFFASVSAMHGSITWSFST